MLRLYLKKLAFGIIYIVLLIIVYFAGSALILTAANLAGGTESVWGSIVLVGLPTLVVWIVIYFNRFNNDSKRREYTAATRAEKRKIISEVIHLMDWRAEMIACFTLTAPIVLAVLVMQRESLLIVNILGAITLFLISEIGYGTMDTLCWFLVLRNWRKNYL